VRLSPHRAQAGPLGHGFRDAVKIVDEDAVRRPLLSAINRQPIENVVFRSVHHRHAGASNLSISSRDFVICSPQAHLTTSAPFRVGQSPCPASMREGRGGASHGVSGFLLPSAAALASWSSFARWGAGPSSRSATGPRKLGTGPKRGLHVAHHEDGPGWVPLYPGTGVYPHGLRGFTPAVRRLSTAASYTPALRPIAGAYSNEASPRVHRCSPSAFPSPVTTGWNGSLGLEPELHHRVTAPHVGRGQACRYLPELLPPSVLLRHSLLMTCAFVSHIARISAPLPVRAYPPRPRTM